MIYFNTHNFDTSFCRFVLKNIFHLVICQVTLKAPTTDRLSILGNDDPV